MFTSIEYEFNLLDHVGAVAKTGGRDGGRRTKGMTIGVNTIIVLTHAVNTKHLYNINTTLVQRLRRWSNIVKILYKCFVFTA